MLLRFLGCPGRKLFISHATKKMWSIHSLSKLRLERSTSLWASAYLAVVQMFVFALNFVNCLYKWCVLVNFYCTYYQICVSRFNVIYDALASLYVVEHTNHPRAYPFKQFIALTCYSFRLILLVAWSQTGWCKLWCRFLTKLRTTSHRTF